VEETDVMGYAKLIKTRKLISVKDQTVSHKGISEWKGEAKEVSSLQRRTEVYQNTIELSVPQLARIEVLQSFKEQVTFVGNVPTECSIEGWAAKPNGEKTNFQKIYHFENGSWKLVIDLEFPPLPELKQPESPSSPKDLPPIYQRNQSQPGDKTCNIDSLC
jgi:hypothetical protein